MNAQICIASQASGNVAIPCLDGQRIRILSVFLIFTGPLPGFDEAIVQYKRSGDLLLETCAPSPGAGCANFTFAIGLPWTHDSEQLVDPATGAVSYGGMTKLTAGLPNITWDIPINLTCASQGATAVQSSVVVYEVQTPAPQKTKTART